jgi:hypothetical protein
MPRRRKLSRRVEPLTHLEFNALEAGPGLFLWREPERDTAEALRVLHLEHREEALERWRVEADSIRRAGCVSGIPWAVEHVECRRRESVPAAMLRLQIWTPKDVERHLAAKAALKPAPKPQRRLRAVPGGAPRTP